ncbi:McrB family protein [Nocardiopsis eucommiae]|uniref:McrB family protein n=1 Tax=Nocardiopsis eucommiae TaxID=2831970 RepID=UPI003D74143D
MASRSELSSRITRALFEVLSEHPEGLHKNSVQERVRDSIPDLETGWVKVVEGTTTPSMHMGWIATEAVKAGWIRKDGNGTWTLTGAGLHILSEASDGSELYRLIRTRYLTWRRKQSEHECAYAVLQSLPEGGWVALPDLAMLTGLDEGCLAQHLSAVRPEGWHRVLDEEARSPASAHLTERENSEANKLLEADAILGPGGWTLTSYRVSLKELRDLLGSTAREDTQEETNVPPRAWLLRSTGVGGDSSVDALWLARGICAIPSAGADTLRTGVSEAEVRDTVQQLLPHWSVREHDQLSYALHSFVSKMRAGDTLLTNVGRQVHLGTVSDSELESNVSLLPGHLIRRIDWHTRSAPLDVFADLSTELASRIGTPNADLLDLTGFSQELDELLSGASHRPSTPMEAALPSPTPELAHRVFMDEDWLAECVDLLRDKPQLVLYGPPGTGKTHVAQELARHLTSDRPENVQLVQFHPSYSYEDFFEGYRPYPGDAERSAGFTLTHGPLRTLASAARRHPAEPFVLIIDEINRGNLAKVFGELYFLLEYRNRSVRLLYGSEGDAGFVLPQNLIIIGTMNTADRSIALVDTAMRRRFWFTELHPSSAPVSSVLRRWLEHHALPATPALLLDELNSRIEDHDFRVGPSYLMRTSVHESAAGLERVWRHQILPLLEEHHYGDGTDVPARYGLESLYRALGLDERP